jgi:predicted amidohydrolase YtcJ
VINFDNKVFDGFVWYGPGTDYPTVDGSCTVNVEITEEPSIIFYDGAVITIEKAQPLAEAVALHDNLIQAVGSNEDILALKGPGTVLIDLQGKTLMPGFVEGHTHYIQNAWMDGISLEEMTSNLVRFGLTSETEMHGAREFIDAMLAAEQNNEVVVRMNIFAQYNYSFLVDGKTVIDPAWYLDNPPILAPSRRVRIPGVKIFVDGAGTPDRGCPYDSFPFASTVTDVWPEVWESCGTPYGDLYLDEAQLIRAIQTIQDRGYRASFHVMGDAAAAITLNAIGTVLDGKPNSIYRHQIQHSSMLSPESIQRYVQLDMISSVPGGFNTCDADFYVAAFGEEHYEWAVNRFSLADLGLHVYGVGDFSRGDVNLLNPFRRLYGLVTLQEQRSDGGVCEPPEWIAQHKIRVERALEMLTIEPAYAVSMENYVGSILPGKYADLIILSDNPLTIDPNRLMDIKVLMTMVNGKVGYCASGNDGYCP